MVMTIDGMVREAYATACEKGWWPEGETPNVPEKIALMHSELSEALEEIRNRHAPDEVYHTADGKPEGFPIELADVLIRIGDLCGHFGIDLAAAVEMKMAFNRTRKHRHGGKTC